MTDTKEQDRPTAVYDRLAALEAAVAELTKQIAEMKPKLNHVFARR
jgi:regulator of replication initiation timing